VVGCEQRGADRVRAENSSLAAENAKLREENATLKARLAESAARPGGAPAGGASQVSASAAGKPSSPEPVVVDGLPVVSINRLVSAGTSDATAGLLGKRVRVHAVFTWVDRRRKALTAQAESGKGSIMDVFYEGTNMEEHFTDNDANSRQRYAVIGTVQRTRYRVFLKAESISPIAE
jgi:hypothetical protein